MRKIKIYENFGSGISLSSLYPDYKEAEHRQQMFPQRVSDGIETAWKESVKKATDRGGVLEDNPLLNFLSMGSNGADYSIHDIILGPISFKQYNSTREFLNKVKDASKYGLNTEDVGMLKEYVDPLSVFPIIVVKGDNGDGILMRRKGKPTLEIGAGKFSFPGAYLLRKDLDTHIIDESIKVNNIEQIITEKIKKQTAISPDEITKSKAIAITKDVYPGSHQNPGIVTVSETNLPIDDIKKRTGIEKDAWQHEGIYIIVPKDAEILSAFISSDTDHGNISLEDNILKEIDGLREKNIKTTGKAGFALFQIGQQFFGDDWYKAELEKHKEHLQVV